MDTKAIKEMFELLEPIGGRMRDFVRAFSWERSQYEWKVFVSDVSLIDNQGFEVYWKERKCTDYPCTDYPWEQYIIIDKILFYSIHEEKWKRKGGVK